MAHLLARTTAPSATACLRAIVAVLLVASAVGLAATPASAMLGDYRLITGTLTLWPHDMDGHRVAVVDGDDADRYFVRITPATATQADLASGARVAVVGREGPLSTQITADSIQSRAMLTAARPRGSWRTITGIVESATPSMLVMRSGQGRLEVDLTTLGPSSVTVSTGDRVTVVGQARGDGKLAAQGIARDITPR